MSKVWKSFNSKAQFLAEKELSEEDLDLNNDYQRG